MKRVNLLLFSLLSLFVSTSNLKGQIQISYIMPDIAASGMNLYVELIAPFDFVGNFGADTTFYGLPTDTLRIDLINPAHHNIITFGPIIVGWQGRMLSTQLFIHPSANPNSWDWEQLDGDFIVPLRVNRNGIFSNIVNFYIVQPFQFGDQRSNPERVLGEGTLGKRSRRGVMIVDEMILAGGTYFVSTNDCDPTAIGNQGYLPFTLLAIGDIVGTSGTRISVDGGRDRIQNGGPGGGGGGGRFYDAGLFCDNSRNGDDGGDGFTGGGGGGRNNSSLPGVTNSLRNQGTGTFEVGGIRGYSLNRVPPSITATNVFEASGGGTGHPFGRSGYSCDAGGSCEPHGQHGGGSGNKQNFTGGSAGHATAGDGAFVSGGKIVGNKKIVPISGGSGGASGNPQSGCNFSGSGGGGGGAMVIFARNIISVAVSARGSQGQASTLGLNANGGGGSGGSIVTAAKLAVENGSNQSVFIEGGKAGGPILNQFGGWGRIRHDAIAWFVNLGSDALSQLDNIYFRGPSTDTTRYIKPNIPFEIKGSKNTSDSLVLMLKPHTGNWREIGRVPSGSSLWSISLSLPKTDSIYYFYAMQYVPVPNKTSEFSATPDFVLSQAAANILIMENLPEIASADTVFVDSLLACSGQELRFKSMIHNIGDADLVLSNPNFANGFLSLATPLNNRIIAPLDSFEVEIIYTYNPAHPNTIIDTLFIVHNDIWYDRAMPWAIRFEIKNIPIEVQNNFYSYTISTTLRDFRANINSYSLSLCEGETATLRLAVVNASQVDLNFENIITSATSFGINILGNRNLLPNDTMTYTISYTASMIGDYSGWVYFKFNECNNYLDSLFVTFTTHNTILEFIDLGDFPETRVGQFSERTIRLLNNGTRQSTITNIANPGNGYSIVNTSPALPISIAPTEVLSITVRFAPLSAGDPITSTLRTFSIRTDSSCSTTADLLLRGTAVNAQVQLSKYEIDFDTLYSCVQAYDTVFVINPATSTIPVQFTKSAEIIGSSNFTIIEQPAIPVSIPPNDSVRIIIRFDENVSGSFAAQLHISTDEISTPDLYAQIFGTRDEFDITIQPDPIGLSDVGIGFTYYETFSITNNGILPLTLANIRFDKSNVTATFNPTGRVISPNETIQIDLELFITNNLSSIERINIEFEECIRSSVQLIYMNILLADTSTNSPIDYGVLSSCEDKHLETVLINTGGAPMIIESRRIDGVDAALFVITGQNKSLPNILYPGESFRTQIRFAPLATTNGLKNAKLKVTALMNGELHEIEIMLIGEKRSDVLLTPNEILFGGIIIGTNAQQTLSVANAGFFDVEIQSIDFPTKYPGEIIVTPDHTGATLLSSGGSIQFDIFFAPTTTNNYFDTLYLNIYYNGCYESVAVAISGRGLPTRQIDIELPELMLLNPRSKNFKIPIYATVDLDTLNNFKIDTLEFRWQRSLFYPTAISNGSILYNTIDGDNRVFGVQIDNVEFSSIATRTLITEITGDVMLGSQTSTPLEITKVVHNDNLRIGAINTSNGTLSIEVCLDGGDRLLQYSTASAGISVNPNPIDDKAEIIVNTIEIGVYQLDLYDILGSKLETIHSWENRIDSDNELKLTSDFSIYSSGVYLLRLNTPTSVKTLIIAKTN